MTCAREIYKVGRGIADEHLLLQVARAQSDSTTKQNGALAGLANKKAPHLCQGVEACSGV